MSASDMQNDFPDADDIAGNTDADSTKIVGARPDDREAPPRVIPDDEYDFDASGESYEGPAVDEENSAGDDDSAGANGDDDSAGKGADKDALGVRPEVLVELGRLNLSQEEIERVLSLENPKAVESMVGILRDRASAEAATAGAGAEGSASEDVPNYYQFPEEGEALEELAMKFSEDPAAVMREIAEADRKVFDHRANILAGAISREAEQRQAMFEDEVDDALQDMEGWSELFGKGYMDQLPDGNERTNRMKVFNEMMSGKYRGSISKRVQSAAKAAFPEHFEKLAQKSNVKKATGRNLMARGTQRRLSEHELTPRQRAIRNVSKSLAAKGVEVNAGAEDYSTDGFL